ncbi:MAG: cellobiose phosphorylase [Tenericutes bacterium HGW-Tenericutes-1]|jgi:cellobiose phosphorylase|nr:MAG: cellobiose phosphorylase [Tenericutes bacterium HGW-Tenericutes-1]
MTHQLKIKKSGEFLLENAEDFNYLYMPLFNESGIMSAISPNLGGDTKLDHHHYALTPVSSEDLVNTIPSRNVFFRVDDNLWSTSGKTPFQKLNPDKVTLKGGLVYQEVCRENDQFFVSVKSFVPTENVNAELHLVTFTNKSAKTLEVKATIGVPIYGRSADNIRDHRHVTSLLNRGTVLQDGIVNEPSMKFDERGHRHNGALYGVFSKSSLHEEVNTYTPILNDFVGEGNDMFYPITPRNNQPSSYHVGSQVDGYDIIAGLGYNTVELNPNNSFTILFGIFMSPSLNLLKKQVKQYLSFNQFETLFTQSLDFWKEQLKSIDFYLGDDSLTGWTKWVCLQPTMRRIYGCSFLPHHDYGRGGRGWRDLWQDSLSLIFKEPHRVREDILGHFAGVRIDGSNATIVGIARGEFHADRNKIVRVWSDHGAWPLLTVDRYLNRTGDIDFLFEKQTYFKDKFAHYTHSIDASYSETQGNFLLNSNNDIYQGSVLEHLLLQNVIPFFNVGDHGNIRIEDADWNDGMDMAKEKGETVAFTALYTGNLLKLVNILKYIKTKNIESISLSKESSILFDTLHHQIDYTNPKAKRALLAQYFSLVKHQISGELVTFNIQDIMDDLMAKYQQFYKHLNEAEWLNQDDNTGWYNGYYNNHGLRLESTDNSFPKMTLTGQTFVLMSQIATSSRIQKMVNAVNQHLTDPTIQIPRLNTNFKENTMDMGRFMGFAYGHKENGSMFSHMAIMYAYSLLDNGFVYEGRKIVDALYRYMSDIDKAKILPGISEYIDQSGRGLYHYLTGSASWMVLTYIEQIFGIKGQFGDLLIQPKLLSSDFLSGSVSINTMINEHLCEIRFQNAENLNYGEYVIESVNGVKVQSETYLINKESVTESQLFTITLGRIQ